jgi:accessory secretory protein Asp2
VLSSSIRSTSASRSCLVVADGRGERGYPARALSATGTREESSRISALSALGVQFGRHTGAYASASGINLVLALIQVAIVTRFLGPSAFGELALLLFLASLLTVTYNLGSLQGIFGRVYGATGDEDADDDDRPDEAEAGRKREALGSGLALTAAVALLGTLILAPFSSLIADALLRESGQSQWVLLAIVCGGLGSVWRLVSNIPRMERQPRRYIWLSATRAIAVIAIVTPLVATGHGIEGVLTGIAAGTAGAIGIGLYTIRASWVPHFELTEARRIYLRGIYLVPIIISFWIVQNVDLFALSRYVDSADVGLYRLAGRIASIASYASSAFFFSWMPLKRGVGFAAAREERGRELEGRVLGYYCVFAASLLVLMTVGADLLVRIAPPAYASAAPLVPLLGGAFVAHGLLICVNRMSSFPAKRQTYVTTVVCSVGLFVIGAMALIPRLGSTGAALAVILAFLPGAAWLLFRNQYGPRPIPIQPRRLLALLVVTLLALAASRATDGLDGVQHALAQIGILIAFLAALVPTGAVPREDLRPLRRIGSQLLGRPRSLGLERGLPGLPPERAGLLWAVTHGGGDLGAVAELRGLDDAALGSDLVADLRSLAGGPAGTPADAAVGLHLFTRTSHADHDANARRLGELGVSAVDLARLELAVTELASLPDGRWPAAAVATGERIAREASASTQPPIGLDRLEAAIKRASVSRMDRMLAEEESFGEFQRYLLRRGSPDSRCLVIAHASTRPGTPQRYAYASSLWDLGCHVVFLRPEGGHVFGFDGATQVAEEGLACQEHLLEELGIERRNVISCGGSAGAIRALWSALAMGYGHAVLGAPLVRLGDWALGGQTAGAKAKLAEPMVGTDPAPGDRKRLNDLMLDKLRNPAGRTTLHVFVSERDQLYRLGTPPLQKACGENPDLELDLTLADYDGHREHRDAFRPYLRAKVAELVSSIDSRPVGSELSASM